MKIKPALRVIEVLQIVGLFLCVVSLYYYLHSFVSFVSLFFAICGMGLLIITTLFKRKIIQFILSRVAYPGVFFDLCERLRFIDNLSVDESNAVLDDLYFPKYETAKFLEDNKLNREIRNAHPARKNAAAAVGVALMLLSIPFPGYISMIVGIPAYIIIVQIINLVLPKRGAGPILYAFTRDGLMTDQGLIFWTSVYNWTAGAKAGRGRSVTIQLVEPGRQELTLYPYHLTHSNVEILMLLAHYKNKYGRVEG